MALPTPPPRKPTVTAAATPAPARREAKKFTVGAWSSGGRGEKVVLYAESGMGKTTLAASAPAPIFVGIDDGGAKIKDPVTGQDLNRVEGITDFQDVRDVLSQPGLFSAGKTVVIDTVTALQDLSIPYILRVIPVSQKSGPACNLESYGYGKGFRHVYDTMLGILSLADNLTAQGLNVVMIAQNEVMRVANAESEDFLKEGPRLQHTSQGDVASLFREWADHCLRIGYQGTVVKDKKAIAGCTTRAVFTQPELWFYAKSRTIHQPVISFETPADDSLWRFMGIKG